MKRQDSGLNIWKKNQIAPTRLEILHRDTEYRYGKDSERL
jgi:hypothetical protein